MIKIKSVYMGTGHHGFRSSVLLPADAKSFHVGVEKGAVYLWFIVDDTKPTIEHHFCALIEGCDASTCGAHIASFCAEGGTVHIFHEDMEVLKKRWAEESKKTLITPAYESRHSFIARTGPDAGGTGNVTP